jgi:hypothetical protein
MQLHSGRTVDSIPAVAQAALILGVAANQPALGVLIVACGVAAVAVAWGLSQIQPTHPTLSPWAIQ